MSSVMEQEGNLRSSNRCHPERTLIASCCLARVRKGLMAASDVTHSLRQALIVYRSQLVISEAWLSMSDSQY